MQTTLLLLVKIGLLLLLWFFIWMTVRSLKKDADRTSGLAPAGGAPIVAGYNAPMNEPSSSGHSFRRHKSPTSLELTSGPLAGTTLNLKGYQDVSIGRSQSCTLVLEDDFASGSHARLLRRGSDWYLSLIHI